MSRYVSKACRHLGGFIPRLTTWTIVGLLIAAASQAKAPELRREWREMSTPNFVLLGDASERQMKDVGRSLESLSSFLGQMATTDVEAPVPTFIYVFKNRRSFAPYEARRLDGKPREVAGFFIQRPHANYIAIDGSHRASLAGIAQHEYVHFFTSFRLPSIPLWFNEGLAEFYSSFEATDNHVNIGKILPHHLQWLQQNQLIPLLDLFSVTHHSATYNEDDRRGVFYAQSWALVHYLFLEVEGGRQQLTRFFELQRTIPMAVAFEQAFGVTPPELERALVRYVRSRSFIYRRADLSIDDIHKQFTFRTLPRAEALARAGELLAIQGIFRFKESDAHLRAALALDEHQVRAHVGLGLLQVTAGTWGDSDEAVGHFSTAHRLAPDDLSIAFLKVQAQARRGDPPRELRAEVNRLIDANPGFINAWRLLARLWTGETENLGTATKIFEAIVHLIPDEPAYAETLLHLYTTQGRTEDADRLMQSYFRARGLNPEGDLNNSALDARSNR